jgi:hypothetical protein
MVRSPEQSAPPSRRTPYPSRPALNRQRRHSPGGENLELPPTSSRAFPLLPTSSLSLSLSLPSPLQLAIDLSLPRSLRRNFLLEKEPSLLSRKGLRNVRLLSTTAAPTLAGGGGPHRALHNGLSRASKLSISTSDPHI